MGIWKYFEDRGPRGRTPRCAGRSGECRRGALWRSTARRSRRSSSRRPPSNERELRECSLHVPDGVDLFAAEDDEQRGKIYGEVLFNGYPPSVFMLVHEDVVVKGTGFTRPRYAYFLVIDGREIGGFERHATHDPPVHKHCSAQRNHEASPSRVMSFKDAAKEAWKYVQEFAQPITELP